jgi:hypothetical protein
MTKRITAWAVPILVVAVVAAWLAWIRGPQPDLGPAPPGAEETAARLLRVVQGAAEGDPADPGAVEGTWYVTAYTSDGRRPVTARVAGSPETWAAPLLRLKNPSFQVDLAIEPTPAARTALGGRGLDVGLDGWIEEDGTIHLPVEFLMAGTRKGELAAFIEEHPGKPLRTFSWIADETGEPARMIRHSLDPGEITPELLRERCDLGGDYLADHVARRGRYDYVWKARSGKLGSGYNLLRHAGTTYSMYQLYNHTGQQRHYDAAGEALEYLRRKRHFAQGDPSRCFEVAGEKVKLGGAGLTLLALVEHAIADPDEAEWEWMHCLAEHIVHQTTESGYMESFYTDSGRFKWSDHKSIYYPGEALLGLVRLYEIDPNSRWLETAVRGSDFLVHERWNSLGLELQTPPDAWLIQALEVLHRSVPDPAYAEYAFSIAEVLTNTQLVGDGAPVDLYGGRVAVRFPHVISTGSRGEGMSAAARLERRVRPGETYYLDRLRANSTYSLRNQYTAPMLFGMKRPHRSLGGFRDAPDAPEIRIDGVQHNLSGLLGLLELLEETP